MENRDRDKMSKRDQPTEAGEVNRDTSTQQSDSNLEFGEKIGRSEDLSNEPKGRSGMTGSRVGSSSKSEH